MSAPLTERGESFTPGEVGTKLFGRELELAVIDDLLENIRVRGGSFLIRGEAGIGKSALLGAARERAEGLGMHAISTSGAPFEEQMPFAGLHRLLRPVIDALEALPALPT